MAMNQDGRTVTIDCPLKDAFIVQGLRGVEEINGLFEFRADLLSDKESVDAAQLVGKAATLNIASAREGVTRSIQGFVNRFAAGPIGDDGLRRFQLTLVPGLWLLGQSAHYRIFSQMNVADVLKQITQPLSRFLTVEFKINGSQLNREHVVQLGETDLEFFNRLVQEEGYSYFFIHSAGSLKLVVTNHAKAYQTAADATLCYTGGLGAPYDALVSSWQKEFSFHTGTFKVTDYNDVTPDTAPLKTIKTVTNLPNIGDSEREVWGEYQYPFDADGQHKFDSGHNDALAKSMMQLEESRYEVNQGSSNAATLCPGATFKLDHLISSENGDYVVTRVEHTAGPDSYQNQFTCIPSSQVYLPRRESPGRRAFGPLTAKVVELKATASGGDKTLLVKVSFPWNNDFKTAWLRVSQLYAGNNWGSVFVPRVSQEVIVEFINGDPDRPIITGALYNGTHAAPPYTVTQSGIRTESKNYNELRFDDKQDNEEVYFQAGKDYNVLVKNNETRTVTNNHKSTISEGNHETIVSKGNQFVTVEKGNQETKVNTGNQTLSVQGNRENTVSGNQKFSLGGNLEESIGGNQTENVGGNSTLSIGGNQTNDISGKQETSVGSSVKLTAGQSITIEASQSIQLKVGGSTLKISPTEISLKMGSNSVKIDATGVAVNGTMVKLNGSAMTEVKAGGMLTLKGGVTMIN